MQKQITEKCALLNKNGTLAVKGYATKMNIEYNRKYAKSFPCKLKEWIFYQFVKDHYAVQLTIGHLTYVCSVTATVIDLDTGKKWEVNSMRALYSAKLDRDPEGPSFNEYKAKDFYMSFEVTKTERILYFKGKNDKFADVEIKIVADNDIDNEKMVIATPFAKKTQFYLNYKENYYNAKGFARFDDFELDLDGATGLVDWGRGVWPFSHEWFWGNMSTHIDGVPFGFNIGWGFGDLSNATENMFFVNKKAYKVGHLNVERDVNDYMAPWHLWDDEGTIELFFKPIYDNFTFNKILFVDTHCDQVYGNFDGWVKTENGKLEIKDKLAFIEHAVNKW